MSEFLARYPAVSGELTLADRVVNLIEEGIDLAVRIGHLDDSSARSRVVGHTRRVVVGSPVYLARRRRPRNPGELGAHTLIHFSSLGVAHEWHFQRGGLEERVAIRPSFVTNSADAAVGHAERGGGLTMVLAYQDAEAIKAGRLEVVLAKHEPPPLPIQLVYPGSRLVSANVRTFIDVTLETRTWDFVDLPAPRRGPS